jgi:hypothetical protein
MLIRVTTWRKTRESDAKGMEAKGAIMRGKDGR